ncbi:protein kinase family protein [Jeotgalibacillus sp. S-D1]|uniref:protein kinase family protein n=1 Tax=Jeotgalibacillus sp. S-D1 TaxID=2552189 RepID=UPI00105A7D0C|nr:protein kinase family protein [Jeotgalibacillus sp. S-D1]TDL34971.1 protein kinase family protein [Jeotgalibacillus sp. S-D1]
MNEYQYLAESVTFEVRRSKRVILSQHPQLTLIGLGRSAAAYHIKDTALVIKVYFPEFAGISQEEAAIYRLLSGSDYYPRLHEGGNNYIVIDYISGSTLFDCLVDGQVIDPACITEVDKALAEASDRGLTPSDIHLRNILLTDKKEIKLIDVARFRQKNVQDSQWKDLKKAYLMYQKPYFPKKLPSYCLNQIAFLYKISERYMMKLR